MWLFTKYGFYSAVCARQDEGFGEVDPNKIMVRARSKNHLQNLQNRFPELDSKILETFDSDYRYRIFVEKEKWSEVMRELANDLDYDNFKNKAKSHLKDNEYLRCLGNVWSIMYDYQK